MRARESSNGTFAGSDNKRGAVPKPKDGAEVLNDIGCRPMDDLLELYVPTPGAMVRLASSGPLLLSIENANAGWFDLADTA